MRVLVKILGVINIVMGVIVLLGSKPNGFNAVTITIAISLFISALVYFYLGYLGDQNESTGEYKIKTNKEIDKLKKTITELQTKLNSLTPKEKTIETTHTETTDQAN